MIEVPSAMPLQSLFGGTAPVQLVITCILIGFALGAIPTSESSNIMVAFLAKKLGVKPREIQSYNKAATSSDTDEADTDSQSQ